MCGRVGVLTLCTENGSCCKLSKIFRYIEMSISCGGGGYPYISQTCVPCMSIGYLQFLSYLDPGISIHWSVVVVSHFFGNFLLY